MIATSPEAADTEQESHEQVGRKCKSGKCDEIHELSKFNKYM